MRRITAICLAAMLAVWPLGGCSKEVGETTAAAGTTAATETTAAEKVTLRFAMWDKDSSIWYTRWAEAYMEENPNVIIELVDLGSTDYNTVLATQLSGGAGELDIISVKDIPGYANLISLGMLEPLNGYAADAGIDINQYKGTVEQITAADGNFYALPMLGNFWLVFYNKDLFDQAGIAYPTNDMTLEEYDQLARQLTSGQGAEKVYGCHYHTWRSAVQLFGVLDGQHTIVDGEYAFLKPYYEQILAQQKDGICMDYATLKTSTTHYSGMFYNNSVAMMNMGSWFIAMQINKIKSGESQAVNWGIVKYPHPEGIKPGTTLGTITSLGVNSKSKYKQEAFDFISFVVGEEGAGLAASFGQMPALMSDETIEKISSMDGFPQDENSKAALKTVKTYLEMPLNSHSADIETALNEAHDDIMTENISVDEGLAEMSQKVQAIIK